MSCRICGRDCPPGAKICRDCAAARKRAFAQTVTQPLLAAVGAPSVGEPRFAPKPRRGRAANDPTVERAAARAEPAAALPLTTVPRNRAMLWMTAAAVLLTIAIVMLLRTIGHGARASEEPAIETPSMTPPAAAPQPSAEFTPVPMETEAPPLKTAPVRASRRSAAHVEAPTPAVTEPPPEPAPAVVRAPSPLPRPVEAPRPDPMQALNEGLARCARQAIFDRIGCEQKLRLQYCGSSWGLVPQCPIGPATDHGQ